MEYNLIVRPEAEKDLNEAFDWYESQRIGLGYDFLLQIEAGICFIEKNLNASPEVYKKIKRCIIKRFPYNIFYFIDGTRIIILAVLYGGRNPNLIKKRIKIK